MGFRVPNLNSLADEHSGMGEGDIEIRFLNLRWQKASIGVIAGHGGG